MKRHSQRGIALIITLIMLSVITFMAVTFLIISRGEKGSVTTALDRSAARLAADTALERAKAELLANLLATTNPFINDLLVSTNYINWSGFQPGIANVTNVSYQYWNGTPVTNAADLAQNIANLLIDPRPPVFIMTNRGQPTPLEFRFYLDLNRNGRYETNGFWPVISPDPNRHYYNTNGNMMPAPIAGQTLSDFFVGDPEWIGVLERPGTNYPHSANNRFVSRYAFIALPAGKTLDLNYIHNQAKFPNPVNGEGFLRNQGVGTWEINLAAFLADLNTNQWWPSQNPYKYTTLGSGNQNPWLPSAGAAFEDALALLRYRYGGSWYNLSSVEQLFGQRGDTAFWFDYIDGYASGPLMTNHLGWNVALDYDELKVPSYSQNPNALRTAVPWAGAGNTNKYFALQDLFDPAKAGYWTQSPFNITNRLRDVGTNISSYNRYTFYRLLAQLGVDSVPEPPGKMNLNYDNLDPYVFLANGTPVLSANGVAASINFVDWQPLDFFYNAADRLLQKYTAEWFSTDPANYMATFGRYGPFGVANIPVFFSGTVSYTNWVGLGTPVAVGTSVSPNGARVTVSTTAASDGIVVLYRVSMTNCFTYTPSVQRLLQLAVNLYDATTNRTYAVTNYPYLPTVFQPVFTKQGNNVWISGYVEVGGKYDTNNIFSLTNSALRDLSNPNDVSNLQPYDRVFGVPLVIGAKKGFPNFNEFAMQNIFQITRKAEIHRDSLTTNYDTVNYTTNVMYILGISNSFGVEAWNSYRSNYTRAVDIYVLDRLTMALTMTDQFGATNIVWTNALSAGPLSVTNWQGYGVNQTLDKYSFRVPLLTNLVFLPASFVRLNPPAYALATNTVGGFENIPGVPWPQWGLVVTNKLLFYMVDRESGRLIDYVQLNGLNNTQNLSEAIRTSGVGFSGLWNTNLNAAGKPSAAAGLVYQIAISQGRYNAGGTDWRSYGNNQADGRDKEKAIDGFLAFFGYTPMFNLDTVNTNLTQQVPFTPTRRLFAYQSWQANDPLVHYMADDLVDLTRTNFVRELTIAAPVPPLENIGKLNVRYEPWGGNPEAGTDPNAYNLAIKDPGVRTSDDWLFPTNKYATVGWLGRVHRGTPWQTVYLKAADILKAANGANIWRQWSGNLIDAVRSAPANNRLLFDLFTTAFNDNATRGQLSINQTNLAAWSALLSGVVVLTNTASDYDLQTQPTRFAPWVNPILGTGYGIDPAGADPTAPLLKIVNGINRTRADTTLFPQQVFTHLGDILATPELTVGQTIPANYVGAYPNGYWPGVSPFLNLGNPTALDISTHTTTIQQREGINDQVYEWLPQQVLSLLTVGQPRFVIYSYGQTLRPAAGQSQVAGGPFIGLVTNYQVVAEVATRSVVRLDTLLFTNNTAPLRITTNYSAVVESYNVLPPD